jgi:thioredoxin reductase (NADPH)
MAIVPDDLAAGGRGLAVETRSHRGVRRAHHARSVVLATGSYDHPNMLGVPGEDLPHVSHYFKEAHPFYRKRVVVVGGKNSAAETSLELHRAGALVTLVHRGSSLSDSIKYWVKPDIENRIKEGSIAARFDTHVVAIRPTTILVERDNAREEIPADAVFLHTGYHSDTGLFERAGIAFDPETCVPQYDPETLETNVPNLYLAGSVVAGRKGGLIFIENGRFHGENVVSVIKRRFAQMSLHADG